jgi:hypothetical protein
MSCRIEPNTEFEQGAVRGQHSQSFEETNFPEQGKNQMHTTSHRVSLYNIYFIFMIVHLRVGVWWKLVALQTPLLEYLAYPYERNRTIVWLLLRNVGHR